MSSPVPVDSEDSSTWWQLTPATRRLNECIGNNSQGRRLTPSEIELLLQSKRELAEQAFTTQTRAPTHKVSAAT